MISHGENFSEESDLTESLYNVYFSNEEKTRLIKPWRENLLFCPVFRKPLPFFIRVLQKSTFRFSVTYVMVKMFIQCECEVLYCNTFSKNLKHRLKQNPRKFTKQSRSNSFCGSSYQFNNGIFI